jgi:hypothetical protein
MRRGLLHCTPTLLANAHCKQVTVRFNTCLHPTSDQPAWSREYDSGQRHVIAWQQNATTYQIHATTEDVAQWLSLTVSRPPQQPLHRLSHPPITPPAPSLPLLEGPGQLRHLQPYWMFVRRQDTTKQFLGNSASTCLCAVVLRVRLPARADVGYAVDGRPRMSFPQASSRNPANHKTQRGHLSEAP